MYTNYFLFIIIIILPLQKKNTQINHDVRPDSNLILHAAQEVTEEEGFDDLLQSVRDRVDEIESLHRTRELTVSFTIIITNVSIFDDDDVVFTVQRSGEG